jgi:hypothetical protein
MTLVLTINGPETIWLLADRRLSYQGRPPKDDARKLMFLETTDGLAILGYAGLGATAVGTEPADWMSAVLRGRSLTLEQSLGALADAMKKQLPRHIVQMPGAPAHNVFVPAFVGEQPRLYTIDLVFAPDRKSYQFRYTRHVVGIPPAVTARAPRLGLAGSGGHYLAAQDKRWMRDLLRVARAHDRGQVMALAVADQLAKVNNDVHAGIGDKSVGPRCIVAWRHRKGGGHKGGGGQQSYTGTARVAESSALPTIANGMDVQAIAGLMMPRFMKMFEDTRAGRETDAMNKDHINAELARLPDKPDEELR